LVLREKKANIFLH